MRQLSLVVVAALSVLVACGNKSSPTSPAATPPATGGSATPCSTWAGQQRASGAPPAVGSVVAERQALYDAGDGIRALNGKYYGAYFPSTFGASGRSRVMVALHGTGGSPEGEWVIDWASSLQARGWGFLGLKYLDDATGAYDDETAVYSQIKAMIDEVRASCAFGSPSIFLVGFSRGSAQAFSVSYLDLKDRRLFTAIGNNSGAWPHNGPLTPTLAGVESRNETTAFSGGRFWMYCGELDMEHGYPMCDEMQNARTFVETRGASILSLYRDPTGGHGGLNKNADALSKMFAAFEGL